MFNLTCSFDDQADEKAERLQWPRLVTSSDIVSIMNNVRFSGNTLIASCDASIAAGGAGLSLCVMVDRRRLGGPTDKNKLIKMPGV